MSEKSKNILLGVLIVGLVSMTVAYAALSTSLQINGSANVAATSWDIHFADVVVDTENTNVSGYSLGTLDSKNTTSGTTGTLIQGLTVPLAKPGDKLTVNFKIVNAGSIDAKLASFTKHISMGDSVVATDTADTKDVVTYTITCDGSNAPQTDSVLYKTGGTGVNYTSCKLTILYNDLLAQRSQTAGQNQAVSQDAKTLTFDATWNYVQR